MNHLLPVLALLVAFCAIAMGAPLADANERSADKGKGKGKAKPLLATEAQLLNFLTYATRRLAATAHSSQASFARHYLIASVRRLKRHGVPLTRPRARFLLYRALHNALEIGERQSTHLAIALVHQFPARHLPAVKVAVAKAAAKKAVAKKVQTKALQKTTTKVVLAEALAAKVAAEKLAAAKLAAAQAAAAKAKAARIAAAKAAAAKAAAAKAAAKLAAAKATTKGSPHAAKLTLLEQKVAQIARGIISYLKRHLMTKRDAEQHVSAVSVQDATHDQQAEEDVIAERSDVDDLADSLLSDSKVEDSHMKEEQDQSQLVDAVAAVDVDAAAQDEAKDDSDLLAMLESNQEFEDDTEDDLTADEEHSESEWDNDIESAIFDSDVGADIDQYVDAKANDANGQEADGLEEAWALDWTEHDEGNRGVEEDQVSLFNDAMDKYKSALGKYHEALKEAKDHMTNHR